MQTLMFQTNTNALLSDASTHSTPAFFACMQTLMYQTNTNALLTDASTHSTPAFFACVQTLMYNAGMYGRAQAMRREGNAPAGACV